MPRIVWSPWATTGRAVWPVTQRPGAAHETIAWAIPDAAVAQVGLTAASPRYARP
jgi:hypothetical protein